MTESRPLIEGAREFSKSFDGLVEAYGKVGEAFRGFDLQLTAMMIQSMLLIRDAERLYKENEKLRRAVDAMFHCMNDRDCDLCTMNDKEPDRVIDERTFNGCDGLAAILRDVGYEIGE